MQKVTAARLSVISNTFLVLLKLGVGLMMNSVSVMAEAIHSGLDLLAAVIAYFSVRESGKPADERHPFGHGKIENLSGTIEALLIFGAALWIIFEGVSRLTVPHTMQSTTAGLAVMGVSAGLNLFISTYLAKVARATDSIALQADAMHLRTDVYTSVGVLGGLLLIKLTGRQILDPLLAIAVALLIIKASVELIKASALPLLDTSLPTEEKEEIRRVLDGFRDRYVNVHSVRTRRAGAERHIDLHMVLPKDTSIAAAHRLCDEIEEALARTLPNVHVLIHVEPCDHAENGRCKTECHDGAAEIYGRPPRE